MIHNLKNVIIVFTYKTHTENCLLLVITNYKNLGTKKYTLDFYIFVIKILKLINIINYEYCYC